MSIPNTAKSWQYIKISSNSVFAGSGSEKEILLSVDPLENTFSVEIIPLGSAEEIAEVGTISVIYDTASFKVYNTGNAGLDFLWILSFNIVDIIS